MGFILYTTYYLANDESRNNENSICLANNLENDLIKKIYLFLQNDQTPEIESNPKIEFVRLGRRPTFFDFLNHSNSDSANFMFKKIIANSDIYFTDSLSLISEQNLHRRIITLTRWDLKNDGQIQFYNRYLSQDTWIFQGFVPDRIGDYFIGQHGCDNRILKEFCDNGFEILNPSLVVKSIHVHMSELRPYFDDPNYKYVDGPYLYSFPSGLISPLMLVIFFLTNRKKYTLNYFSIIDFYQIRFEYNFLKLRNDVKHFNFNYIERLGSFFKVCYFYFCLRLSKLMC